MSTATLLQRICDCVERAADKAIDLDPMERRVVEITLRPLLAELRELMERERLTELLEDVE